MAVTDRPSIKTLISRVVQHAKKQVHDDGEFKLFSRFIRLFYAHASVGDLYHRSMAELFGMVQSHWALMKHCDNPESICQLRVYNPDFERDGWRSSHTVVELVAKDMPFIIDSMRMEMARLGFTVHLMIYMGGIKVSRDSEGYVTNVAPYHASHKPAMQNEAPVYMEIDRQTDPAVLEMIQDNLRRVLSDVQATVEDWVPMQKRVRASIETLRQFEASDVLPVDELNESIAFLEWLLDGQFTFLGVRDYDVVGNGEDMALRLVKKSGLGVLRDDSESKMYRQFADMPEPARELMLSSEQLLVISKTNTLSTVHRHAYTDYIGIKQFDSSGKLVGERRIIGLYTSTAYSSHPKAIPFLRHKVASILKQSGLPPKSHAGKDLMHILETFPRDDLFQATTNELYDIAVGILNLQERQKTSVFVREDAYGRYVSCLVYVPRDNFNSQVILAIQDMLMDTFNGVEANYTTYFYTPILTRIHYIIRIKPKKKLRYHLDDLELNLIEVTRSWQDGFRECVAEYFGEGKANQIIAKYARAFPAGYRETFSAMNAVIDIEHIESLSGQHELGMSLYRPLGPEKQELKFKLFRYGSTMPLSDALPILENMGLRVIGEQPYQLVFKDQSTLWINDFSMTSPKDVAFDIDKVRTIFQETFDHVWLGDAENDAFNALVLRAELSWREIALLRAYTKYLRQTGFTYSPAYVAEALTTYPGIAKLLVQYFHQCFSPELASENLDACEKIEAQVLEKIDDVLLLDEDRIFRRILVVMKATLRTNFYQLDENGQQKSHITFKLSPERIPELPLPLPKYEIFVYSPHFEGVHLRAAKVARGGLRWSDRREDFRTEVLGLMKAQQVKNAVIVPAGAKGGFVPKNLPLDGSREAIMDEAIRCYRGFIQGLLDVTDNLVDGNVVPPNDVIRYDDDDPYLVVAADKGTASFSDIANKIAVDHGFWLGDAFASGGSTGYDHKKMGITARGAWVSAERHFQGLGFNVNDTEISVVGIGDMAGDVFGNGVLLSKHLKLVCAFNHLHIFIDPNPDVAKSFEERKRLFALPRSSWTDYNPELISKGGGVFSRAAKSIALTKEIRTLLDVTDERMTPNELITAILKSPVDMIWNGGIGTFVKSHTESNEHVGDRTNDVLRINANQLRARAVVEGGNLGLTQLARMEFALNGGLINTDFIDNSAGVDSSDHEVNIKILLNKVVSEGDMTEKQRNSLLAKMTNEVAQLVLKNNYYQNQGVSFLSELSHKHMNLYMQYIDAQEQAGKLKRKLEYLPSNKVLIDRRAKGLGLTRPEISVLFSYSKIILEEAIGSSDLVDDPALASYVFRAFPKEIRKKFGAFVLQHQLRKEILSTQLSNHVVTQMGITFIYQMQDETAAAVSDIVRAFIAVYEIFDISDIYAQIQSLDYTIDMAIQYEMIDDVMRLVRRATRWMLRCGRDYSDLEETIAHFKPRVKDLYKRIPKLLLGGDKDYFESRQDALMNSGVPDELSLRIAGIKSVYHALNIILAASSDQVELKKVAKIYFTLVDRLDLHWFRDKINAHPVSHHWSVLAKAAFKADLDWILRQLTMGVVKLDDPAKSVSMRVDAWIECHKELMQRWQLILTGLRNDDATDFSIISVAIRELFDLAQACEQQAEALVS